MCGLAPGCTFARPRIVRSGRSTGLANPTPIVVEGECSGDGSRHDRSSGSAGQVDSLRMRRRCRSRSGCRRARGHQRCGRGISPTSLSGTVLSDRVPLAGQAPDELGRALTGPDGSFSISYPVDEPPTSVLYLVVGDGATARMATVLGVAPAPATVVVNERTTVATVFAMAQFMSGDRISGPSPGPVNAALMAANLADVRTGNLSEVLQSRPNGVETSTLKTFDSLANMMVPCVRSDADCDKLFRLATPPGGVAPRGALDAMVSIARNLWNSVDALLALAQSGPAPYQPALAPSERPDDWILALSFDGDGMSVDGPGNSAIDVNGNVWVTNNYTYSSSGSAVVCGSPLILEFAPDGGNAAGAPFSGGGASGAGYGITLDPRGTSGNPTPVLSPPPARTRPRTPRSPSSRRRGPRFRPIGRRTLRAGTARAASRGPRASCSTSRGTSGSRTAPTTR